MPVRESAAGPPMMDTLQGGATASTTEQRDVPMAGVAEAAHRGSSAHAGDSQPQGQEAVYVLLDLDGLEAEAQLRPGHTIELSGLDTFQPTVKLPDGTACASAYEETIGSCMLFGISGDTLNADSDAQPERKLQYICSTERVLKVKRPPAQKPP